MNPQLSTQQAQYVVPPGGYTSQNYATQNTQTSQMKMNTSQPPAQYPPQPTQSPQYSNATPNSPTRPPTMTMQYPVAQQGIMPQNNQQFVPGNQMTSPSINQPQGVGSLHTAPPLPPSNLNNPPQTMGSLHQPNINAVQANQPQLNNQLSNSQQPGGGIGSATITDSAQNTGSRPLPSQLQVSNFNSMTPQPAVPNMNSLPQSSQPSQHNNLPPPQGVNTSQRMGMPPPRGPPGPTSQQYPLPTSGMNQVSDQMGAMNLNGPQPYPSQQMALGSNLKPTNTYPSALQSGPRYPSVNGATHPHLNGLPDSNVPPRGNIPPPQMQNRYPPQMDSLQQTSYAGSTPAHPSAHPGMPQPPPTHPTGGYPSAHTGYPPQPSPYPAQQPSFPGQQPGYPGQQQQQRRLDPDQMPSPMQVIQEDQRSKSGLFYTNQKGLVPPLVTTDFIVQDQGNASPRFIRATMYNVPATSDMMKQTSVPFGLVISPMAEVLEEEQPPPLVDFGELGPVRCVRCKAYMSPNMQFIDGGRRFHCLLCKASTKVPDEYFQHVDHTGLRIDRYERAELLLGTYDIVATKEYCGDNIPPLPPALIFLIDVSYNNVKSGLVSLLCSQMKNFLRCLPRDRGEEKTKMRVGFITYNCSVHFYNLSPNLGQPQMLVVGDTQEMFMPLLDGFLADVEESEVLIDALMTQIPNMFAETRETETILAPAIQAGLEALKASRRAGKLLVFHSSLPICEAPGKLNNRDDRKLLGTVKEKTVLTPQNTVYNNLGQECVAAGCSVDLFVTNNSYIDLPTIGQVSRLTGGEVYKYTYFQADLDGERLITDVEKDIKRLCAFDAIMRVRTSTGIRPTDFCGHFFMSNTTDVELACIDPDKTVAIEVKHDDKLSEEEGVYIQAALLYTSLSGQRRIRVLNLSLKACSQMTDLYRACELDTIMNFLSKQAVYKLLDSTPKAVRDSLITKSAQMLACYRKNCASPTSAGQLILPECMKLLPLYINCLLKCDAISGGSDMTIDDRWFTMAAVMTMDIPTSLNYFYPRLLSLHDMENDFPAAIRCSAEKMADDGVYLLENGIYMFLWIGLEVPSQWLMSVFGVQSTAQINPEKSRLPILDNPLSEKIRSVISNVAKSRHRTMRMTIIRQRDKMEVVMKHFLVEDKGIDGSSSYVDFLCHLHKEIRNLMS